MPHIAGLIPHCFYGDAVQARHGRAHQHRTQQIQHGRNEQHAQILVEQQAEQHHRHHGQAAQKKQKIHLQQMAVVAHQYFKKARNPLFGRLILAHARPLFGIHV